MVISAHHPSEVRAAVDRAHREGRRVGFVPTMGALHVGHQSLMARARLECDLVVVSIFVNPLQFDSRTDFDSYPSTLGADLELCAREKVDVVYSPNASTMYPTGFDTRVVVGSIGSVLEGRSRAGHYDGVATVVAKLLSTVTPDVAYFGQKDFQQTLVVKRLVADLNVRTEVTVIPTVRDFDGLAMSSRNVRLSHDARRRALAIPRALDEVAGMFANGRTDTSSLVAHATTSIEKAGLAVDYVTIADSENLDPRPVAQAGDVMLIAATVDGVRLIDNAILG